MDIKEKNINNLLNLWRLAGEKSGIINQMPHYEFSWIPGSAWPNKLWFNSKTSSGHVAEAIQVAKTYGLGISFWDGINIGTDQLESEGFELKTQLSGMSIELGEMIPGKNSLEIIKVKNSLEASRWSDLFERSFGYRIDSYTVLKTSKLVNYYIAHSEGQPVGTAVLYSHEAKIAGIHSMGIIPEMRRKGFAEELLLSVLNIGKASGAEFVTLQSSVMGKGLYLKTGFQDLFTLKTFINKTQNNNEFNRQFKMEICH